MAQLDNFFDYMCKYKGTELCLESGNEPKITVAGKVRTMAKQKLSFGRIMGMLKEVVTPEMMEELQEDQRVEFVYASSACSVKGCVFLDDKNIRVVFTGYEPAKPAVPEKAAVQTEDAGQQLPAAPAESEKEAQQTAETPKTQERREGVTIPDIEVEEGRPAIERLFKILLYLGGSDLHISTGAKPVIRKDGTLVRLDELEAPSFQETEALLLEIAPDTSKHELKERHDTVFSYEIEGLAWVRCSLFRDFRGFSGSFRLIPAAMLTAKDIGLSAAVLELCLLPRGLVIVSGPSGSGKSTTLCAMIDHMNEIRHDHIIVIEDPIEFVHQNKQCLIQQRMVGVHTDSFFQGLAAARRNDADVIVVGELDSPETVSLAVETADAGHLVLGSVPTSTAVSTVDRLIEQVPVDRQPQFRGKLAEVLKGVVSQTLCAMSDGGRIAVMEVLLVNNTVAALIKEGKTFQIPSVMQATKSVGMVSLHDALLKVVDDRMVSPQEAYFKAVNKEMFVDLLRRHKHDVHFLKSLEAVRGL